MIAIGSRSSQEGRVSGNMGPDEILMVRTHRIWARSQRPSTSQPTRKGSNQWTKSPSAINGPTGSAYPSNRITFIFFLAFIRYRLIHRPGHQYLPSFPLVGGTGKG